MSKPTVAILGASTDRKKFGNKAVRAHLEQGYDVFPVNVKGGEVEGQKAYVKLADVPAEKLDRISVYLPPGIGITMLDEIKEKAADEVFFNPGSESFDLLRRAEEIGLEIIMACSITNIGISPQEMTDE